MAGEGKFYCMITLFVMHCKTGDFFPFTLCPFEKNHVGLKPYSKNILPVTIFNFQPTIS